MSRNSTARRNAQRARAAGRIPACLGPNRMPGPNAAAEFEPPTVLAFDSKRKRRGGAGARLRRAAAQALALEG